MDIMVQPIRHLYCQKILPLVYDDSLSYYEALCKFVAKVNEVVDALNNVSVNILDDAKAYTDSAIANQQQAIDNKVVELQMIIDGTVDRFDLLLNELQEQYTEFTRLTNIQLDAFNSRITQLDKKIDDSVTGVNTRTDLAIEQNNQYIFDKLSLDALDSLTVVNFFTGQRISVQDMFDYLANLHVDNGIDYATIGVRDVIINTLIGYNASYTNLVINGNTIIN